MFTETAKIPDELAKLLKDSVSPDVNVSGNAKNLLTAALTSGPLRSGNLFGDTVSGIFNMVAFEPGTPIEFPLDIVGPSDVNSHIAYTWSDTGYVPQRTVEGNYIAVRTYMVRNSIDWSREMARNSRWDVVSRALQVHDAGVVRKRNNDGWYTIITAAANRGISISDTSIATGLFGKRVVALAETVLRRNAGGNSTSVNRGKLTHIAMSPESLQDVRSWDLTQVDDITRREIFLAQDNYSLTKIFGVTLVDIDEFGVGQEYQNYYNNVLGGSNPNSKEEIAIGLDLMNGSKDSFLMPWVKRDNGQFLEMYEDPTLLRFGRFGYWSEARMGTTVLDSRRVIILGI